MKTFLEILTNYWELILGVLCLLVSFILALVTKKPVNDILTDIYQAASIAVNKTEMVATGNDKMKGSVKLAYAASLVVDMLTSKYPTLNVSKYSKIITSVIEEFLAAPTKKGGSE